jgi:hypothetical protein
MVQVKLSREDARSLERLRASWGLRTWTETFARLLRAAATSNDNAEALSKDGIV